MTTSQKAGTVFSQDNFSRSNLISTPASTERRNRLHLNVVPSPASESSETVVEPAPKPSRIVTMSQTGTVLKPPISAIYMLMLRGEMR